MMHDTCNVLNAKNICMSKYGCCKNSYPKHCNEQTTVRDEYPIYRRRYNGMSVNIGDSVFYNRWVVAYSPYMPGLIIILMLKFQQ